VKVVLLALLTGSSTIPSARAQVTGAAPSDLPQNIAKLSSFDYPERMQAARLIRRTDGAAAVPALVQAVKDPDGNEYVRYRALVLLTSFNDRGTGELMRSLVRDPNDRVRQVAFEWLERHPDTQSTALLLGLLQTETADFVRPALVGALAAINNPDVQRPLINEISRGLDFFRSAVIEALGRHHATYALDAIVNTARLKGPLQDVAVQAIGRIGGTDAASLLDELTDVTAEAEITRRGARCLAGQNCQANLTALTTLATDANARRGEVDAALQALATVGQNRNEAALAILVRLATGTSAVRESATVALGSVALREPDWTVAWIGAAEPAVREAAIIALKDGFDSLEEDFAEEQFFAAVRAGYWRADEGSPGRALAETLIRRLEF